MLRRGDCWLVVVVLCGTCPARASEAGAAPFIGRMPQGTVELVAVANWPPTKQSKWWKPDGSPTTIGPLLPEKTKPMRSHRLYDTKAITCLLRFANLPADASYPVSGFDSSATFPWFGGVEATGWPYRASLAVNSVSFQAYGPLPEGTRFTGGSDLVAGSPSWHAAGSTGVVDGSKAPAPVRARSSQPAATDRRYSDDPDSTSPPCYEMIYTSFLTSASTTTLRVGVSMGAWETVVTHPSDRGGSETFSRDGKQWTVEFRNHMASEGKADKILICHAVPRGILAMRLVAVADDGSEHVTSVYSSPAAVSFGQPLSSIKEFRLQVRPYHWVEFQDVSIRPGWTTAVHVTSLEKFD